MAEHAEVIDADPLLELMGTFDIDVVPGSVLQVAGYVGDDLRLHRRAEPESARAPLV